MSLQLPKLVILSAALVACGPSSVVGVGLANAPSAQYGLPVPAADSRPHDMVANGLESCEQSANGTSPLRGAPSCPRAERASGETPSFIGHASARPLVQSHMPCWTAADPWPDNGTRASSPTCGHLCSPTLVACSGH